MNYGLENFQYFIDFRKVVQILIIKRMSLSIFQSKRSKSLSKKAAESFNFRLSFPVCNICLTISRNEFIIFHFENRPPFVKLYLNHFHLQ